MKGETNIEVEGIVSSTPVRYFNKVQFESEGLFVSVATSESINEGDQVVVQGKMNNNRIEGKLVSIKHINSFLLSVKNRLISFFEISLHEPKASMLGGIVLGESKQIDKTLKQQLISSGTIHLFVASGTNIAIISALIFSFVSKIIKRKSSVLISTIIIWLYAGLVGFQAPIIRAALMATIVFSIQYLGFFIKPLTVLIWTLIVMIVLYPLYAFQISFYLSFAATLGIIIFDPLLYKKLYKYVHLPSSILKEFSVSIAAQIAVLPILFLFFHSVSPLGFLSTVLVSWIIFPLSCITILASTVSFFSVGLATIILYLTIPFLDWFLFIVDIFIILITVLTWGAYLSLPDGKLRVVTCDVGQGDAILIVQGAFETLIDAGPDDKVLTCLGKYMPFWDHTIELAVITHPQADHYSGYLSVFKRYSIEHLLANSVNNDTQGYRMLKKEVEDYHIPLWIPRAGQTYQAGVMTFQVFNPLPVMTPDSANTLGSFETTRDLNDYSVLIKLTYGTFTALFTGDIGPSEIPAVLARSKIGKVNLLKVPHHGSNNGLTKDLLEDLAPDIATISVGKGNRYGHPNESTLKMLSDHKVKTYRTDEKGDIVVETNGTSFLVK